jgi:hypothetical protein
VERPQAPPQAAGHLVHQAVLAGLLGIQVAPGARAVGLDVLDRPAGGLAEALVEAVEVLLVMGDPAGHVLGAPPDLALRVPQVEAGARARLAVLAHGQHADGRALGPSHAHAVDRDAEEVDHVDQGEGRVQAGPRRIEDQGRGGVAHGVEGHELSGGVARQRVVQDAADEHGALLEQAAAQAVLEAGLVHFSLQWSSWPRAAA